MFLCISHKNKSEHKRDAVCRPIKEASLITHHNIYQPLCRIKACCGCLSTATQTIKCHSDINIGIQNMLFLVLYCIIFTAFSDVKHSQMLCDSRTTEYVLIRLTPHVMTIIHMLNSYNE